MKNKPPIGLTRHTAGFTLIEFLVASAVLAVMAGVAYSGWFNVEKIAAKTRETTQRFEKLERTFDWFSRDFEQLVARDVIDELGSKSRSLVVNQEGEYVIELTRGGWTNPALLELPPRSHLQRVAYRIDDDGRLLRRYWYHVDNFEDATFRDRLLLRDVESLTFRFLDLSGSWQNSWPPEDVDAEEFSDLPIGLEATLEIARLGSLRRLYVLPN